MGGGSPVPLPAPLTVGLILIVRGFGDKVRPPKDEIEDVDECEVEEYDVDDDGRPALGNPGMGIGRVRAAALSEPGGELVGDKVSGGEV